MRLLCIQSFEDICTLLNMEKDKINHHIHTQV